MGIEELLNQLTPANKRLAENLIKQLAEAEGVHAEIGGTYLPPVAHLDLWRAYMTTEAKSPRTIDMYYTDVARILARIPEPTELLLQGYFAERLKHVSASRVASEQKAVKSLFKYLYRQGLYPSNPTKDVVLVKGRTPEVECPANETIMALLRYNPMRTKDRPKYKLMLFMLVQSGLRIEEACSLRRDWINVGACEVRVIGKGNYERTVPVGELVARLLEDYMATYDTGSKWLFPAATLSGYWNNSGFRKELYHACDKLGLPRIHPHQLRHYFATRTLENGAKLEVISRILGHKSVDITAQTYRHIQLKEFHAEHGKHNPLAQLPDAQPLALPEGGVVEGEFKEVA